MASGIRGVYAYGFGAPGPAMRHPDDIRRLRRQYFSSADQLVTLALATAFDPAHWRLAREVGAPITVHANGTDELLPLAEARLMGPDVTYIHCCRLSAEEWKLIADTGGTLSIAAPVEMEMGHGIPAVQQALDHAIPLSLSNDVETSTTAEFFTQMRTVFLLQRMQLLARARAGEQNLPPLMNVKQVVEIATLGGARANQLEKKVGSLTPGKEADIVMLATNRINVMPLNNAYAAIVHGMDTSNVDAVFRTRSGHTSNSPARPGYGGGSAAGAMRCAIRDTVTFTRRLRSDHERLLTGIAGLWRPPLRRPGVGGDLQI
jgi:cytosine/adenosine deaminase-related metal-dependent hydrolase